MGESGLLGSILCLIGSTIPVKGRSTTQWMDQCRVCKANAKLQQDCSSDVAHAGTMLWRSVQGKAECRVQQNHARRDGIRPSLPSSELFRRSDDCYRTRGSADDTPLH